MHRRRFFAIAGLAAVARVAHAQEATRNTTGSMDQDAYRPVKLPPKPGATPKLTTEQRDALEHHIHCQCGCGLDVFTCRTTDFSCSVSPAMHFDIMGLVAGGYTANEIIAAFRSVYGERVLMEPVREGFNWLAYILPFAALLGGGALVVTLLRRWTRPAPAPVGVPLQGVDATPEEIEQLQRALRDDR